MTAAAIGTAEIRNVQKQPCHVCLLSPKSPADLMGLHPRKGKIPHPLTYIFHHIRCPFLRGEGRERERVGERQEEEGKGGRDG